MAVDTPQKRMSMLEFGDGQIWHTLFEADGAVDADDRAHLLGLYSGIDLVVPVVFSPDSRITILAAPTRTCVVGAEVRTSTPADE